MCFKKIIKNITIVIVALLAFSGCFQASTNNPGDPANVAGLALGFDINSLNRSNAGYTISQTTGHVTTEAGGTSTFTITLTEKPNSDVTVTFTSSNTAEGNISPSQIVFTTITWGSPQSITITGVDDLVDDDNKAFDVIVTSTSADKNYHALSPYSITCTNTDNDTAGFTVNPVTGLRTSESGIFVDFTVVLNSKPTANVVIPSITSTNTAEGTVNLSNLTFTSINWNIPQSVRISGVDDALADGMQFYNVVLAASTSGDSKYSGIDPSDVTNVGNWDNESKLIFRTALTFNGNLGGIAGADQKCMTDANYPGSGTYKAFIVDGVNRIASITPGQGDGQVDWVINADTSYYRPDGFTLIGIANSKALFSANLTNTISATGINFWSGFYRPDNGTSMTNVTWTAGVTSICTAWTFGGPGGGDGGLYGSISGTDGRAFGGAFGSPAIGSSCGGSSFSLVCVQQ